MQADADAIPAAPERTGPYGRRGCPDARPLALSPSVQSCSSPRPLVDELGPARVKRPGRRSTTRANYKVAVNRGCKGALARLEDLTKGALVRGVLGDRAVRVVDVAWHGSNAVTLTYTDEPTGKVDQELLYRDDEPRLSVEEAGRAWSMDADGSLFRLVSEAKRISLAYLFDPFLAVQTSNLDPLPHQIDAVYDKMLPSPAAALPAG